MSNNSQNRKITKKRKTKPFKNNIPERQTRVSLKKKFKAFLNAVQGIRGKKMFNNFQTPYPRKKVFF